MTDLDFGSWVGPLLRGLWVTVYVTLLGALLAVVLAFVLGLAVRLRNLAIRTVARIIIEFFRGTSLLVQLFWLYSALPIVTGWYNLNPTVLAIVALGLNFGAYGAEVVRGGIAAVPRPQWEGAIALNLTPAQRMVRVIIPQAVPLMIPPFGNLFIQLLKSTPLVFLIGVLDVFTQGQKYYEQNGTTDARTFFIFGLLLVIYFVLAYLSTLVMQALERAARARLGQHEPRRRLFGFFSSTDTDHVRVV